MGVLATAIRCDGAEKKRFLGSAKAFAALVLDNYLGVSAAFATGSGRSSTASGGAARASLVRWRSCSTTRRAKGVT